MATNTPPNGAFRGFGAPQSEFAAEMQVNRAAEALGMSPLEIRRRNVYGPGGVTPTQQKLGIDVAGLEVLERAAEASRFEPARARTAEERAARPADARKARGVGLALAWHGAGFTGSGEEKMGSVASLELTADGEIRILTASTEMGQGTKTIFPQLVAAELEVDFDEVVMAPQDTSFVPDSGPTVASRTAMVVGGLLVHAARRLKAQVEERTGQPFGLSYRDDARAHGATRIDEQFVPYPGRHFDDDTYTGDAYPSFGWAAAVAEVEVDLDTAEVAVLSVVAADDVGRIIHPVLCEGQVEGGTLQAVGYATIEEIKLVDGRYLNDRLATYIIPTALDAPRLETILVEAPLRGRAARREGRRRAADGRGRAGGRRRDPRRGRRLGPRPARDAGADPRRARGDRAAGAAGRVHDLEGRRVTTRLTVNGAPVETDAPGMRRLLDLLREDLGLTGTKEGCGEGECGACTVLLDGAPVLSCLVPVCQADGTAIRTVEALAPAAGGLNVLQQAFLETGGAQCGICTPGMLMAGEAFLASGAEPTDEAIREAIAGNLCRCTGYTKIIDAIRLAAERGAA